MLDPASRSSICVAYSESQYRQYDKSWLLQLQQILMLKYIGFSLEEITEIFRHRKETSVQVRQLPNCESFLFHFHFPSPVSPAASEKDRKKESASLAAYLTMCSHSYDFFCFGHISLLGKSF